MDNSTKVRILTALPLIPLVLGAIFYLPADLFALFFALIMMIAATEWANLSGLNKKTHHWMYAIVVTVSFLFPWTIIDSVNLLGIWLVLGCLGWFVWLAKIIRFTETEPITSRIMTIRLMQGFWVLQVAWVSVMSMAKFSQQGPILVMILLLLIWIADSGAYFSGRQWGKKKLAPLVSPGKSWEGVWGAVIFAVIYAVIVSQFINLNVMGQVGFVILCFIVVAFSIVGDLTESILKRNRGMKDSGKLLPGHGGMLDRIDSVLSAAPFFVLGLILLGLIQ
ncbi:MAG: phosphatidate cytidylyltransferase [Methylococcales bacterium]|jgi:phosphatidate cytidylyltransferase|nr:phosphatidate cytidylyltransferase [Methylococcales bacterium]